jgi:hypothetical protein
LSMSWMSMTLFAAAVRAETPSSGSVASFSNLEDRLYQFPARQTACHFQHIHQLRRGSPIGEHAARTLSRRWAHGLSRPVGLSPGDWR